MTYMGRRVRTIQPVFIKINGDLFNVNKIQAITFEDEKNILGEDSGVYMLHIFMEGNVGSIHKAYSDKKQRNEDFLAAQKKLVDFGLSNLMRKESEKIEKEKAERYCGRES